MWAANKVQKQGWDCCTAPLPHKDLYISTCSCKFCLAGSMYAYWQLVPLSVL